MSTKCLVLFCGIFAAIAIYYPTRHARHYDYVQLENVYDELVFSSYKDWNSNLKNCRYREIIWNNSEIDIKAIYQVKKFHKPRFGGEYVPRECNPLIKASVIVPYRNRSAQLLTFLNFIHSFLQAQNVFYRIFIIEQNNTLAFNRARLLNYGARVAMEMGFPCLIMHDVDLIPLTTGNIYGCAKRPRHMSSSLDSFRFNLPYLTLFGGVVAIRSEHFQKVNGMSNVFWGWGGEDDDFYKRLESHDLLPYRFAPKISKYTMLSHKKEKASPNRYKHLKYSLERHRMDGLSSLEDKYSVKLEDLYTIVIVS